MDEIELAQWQAALVDALAQGQGVDEVRDRLRRAVPWAERQIAALDDRALAVAQDLLRRWSPQR